MGYVKFETSPRMRWFCQRRAPVPRSRPGSVSKVEMTPLHCPSKGIAVDKQANDDVVHLCGFREANGLTDQAFNTRPQGQMRALDLLRVSFAWAVDSGVEMTRVGTPIICIISCDPKGFQQGFQLQKHCILTPPK